MPSIAIDTQITLFQKTGVGQYVHNLVEALPHAEPHFVYHLIAPSKTERDFVTPERLWWEQVAFPRLARAKGASLIHQPAFAAPIFATCPVVVTVHDLTPQLFGNDINYWSRRYFANWMPATYRRVSHFIAVSEHTKHDLMRMQKIPSSKITVIYEAVGPEFSKHYPKDAIIEVQKRYSIAPPYLIHIGSNPRKNLEFLLDVFVEILKIEPSLQLVIVGKKNGYAQRLIKKARALGIEQKMILTDYLTDEERVKLMHGATLSVFPSLYEGFGLPPLESMTLGIPVIASKIASIPEVVGAGGLLVEPTDAGGWITAIRSVLTDQQLRQRLVHSGYEQAQRFSWEKTAHQTAGVYADVLKGTIPSDEEVPAAIHDQSLQ